MNILYPILFNLSALMALTAMYFFWFMGGKMGARLAFPHNSSHKKRVYKPNKIVLFFTTILLAVMTWFCLAQTGSFTYILNNETIIWGNRITGIIFMARAIGNFKYFGFTKTFKEGLFAELDTYLYSPVCLVIALCAWLPTFDI